MLKSLFESSIDRLNIPSGMKTAIKQINNICLEAEGDDKENDLGYTPLGEEDKKKAEQIKADQERKEKEEKDNVPTTIDDAKSDDDIWKVLKNLQQKAVKNRGTEEGEKWRQKLEEEYQKATSTRNFKRVKGLEMTIYNKSNPQTQSAEEKPKEENTDVNNAKSNEEAYEILKNLQSKAVKNRGTEEGEKWRKKLEEEYDKAVRNGQTQRVKGLEMTIYNKGNQQAQTTEGKPEEANNQNTEQQQTPSATSGEQQTQPNANAEQAAQPAANAESEENKGTQIEKGATREPNQVRTSGPTSSEPNTANTEAQPQATPKYRADVATVQLFLNATKPQTNLANDGILGPKTIAAIQQTKDINPTGKMDQKTQEAFNTLLAEAKQKVIPIQKQLGVTADGLIGKQTLAAMQKANMNVASVFNKKPTAPQTQVANNQRGNIANGAANQGNINVLNIKFDESKAQQLLKSKTISQKEYNIWKAFGIAPVYQKRYPKETQNQIAQSIKTIKKQQEANAQANTRKSTAPQQTAQANAQPAHNQAAKPAQNAGTK
jgi:hypothetical protein